MRTADELRRRKRLRLPPLLASSRVADRRCADRRLRGARPRLRAGSGRRPGPSLPDVARPRRRPRLGQLLVRGDVPARLVQPPLLPPGCAGREPPARLLRRGRLDRPLLLDRAAGMGDGRPSGRRASSACSPPRRCSPGSTRTRSVSRRCSPRSSCCSCGDCGSRSSSPRSRSGSARSPSPSSASSSVRTRSRAGRSRAGTSGSGSAWRPRPASRCWRSSSSRARAAVSSRSTGSTSSRFSASRRSACSWPGRARGAGPLVAFYALWGLGSVVVYVVPSPLGDNWTRLSAFIFPVMLLTASLAGFQPRRLVVLALAAAFAYNIVPYALLVPSRLGNDTQQASFWRPAIRFLRGARAGGLPRRGRADRRALGGVLDPEVRLPARARLVPAARRRRQPGSLRERPRRRGVPPLAALGRRPLRPPQHDGAARLGRRPAGGAASCARRASGLKVVFRSPNWTIYELPHATPLLTGPASPVVTSFGHTAIRGRVFAAGRYLLRAHYSPYLRLQGAGCVAPGPDKMTYLDLTRPERFALSVPGTPGRARPGALRRRRSDLRLLAALASEPCRSTSTSAWSASRISKSSSAARSRSRAPTAPRPTSRGSSPPSPCTA